MHLHGIGPYIAARDVVQFLSAPEMKSHLGLDKPVSVCTVQRWLHIMGYNWQNEKKGQYSDGHEHKDVVDYHQRVFLPAFAGYVESMRKWDDNGEEEVPASPPERHTVVWFHDESIFYAHNHHKVRWVHDSESAKPYAKGDGASLMIADFISADYGWLRGDNCDACVTLKPGKNRDGYFSNDEVLEQATCAMDILQQRYPNDKHVLVFDNVCTHSKCAEDALSAVSMPRNPKHWGVTVSARDTTGKILYLPNGKPQTQTKQMANTTFNGQYQSLYFPDNHPMHPGHFKGMAQILKEHGHPAVDSLYAQCPKFHCRSSTNNCCCCNILFNSDDFINIPCLLMTHCEAVGFEVLFLPKFHCELNFIEQVWGFAKWEYHEAPPSSKIEDVEKNAKAALDKVSLLSMQRYMSL